jgi:uncharacterized RDD family membrane protein YckC/cytoskeletal protein CcmA (bactofilin family)
MKFKLTAILFSFWLGLTLAFLPTLRAEDAAPAENKTPAAVAPPPEPAKAGPPEVAAAAAQPAADQPAVKEKSDEKDEATGDEEPAPAAPPEKRSHHQHRHSGSDNERVGFAQDSTLAAGEQADAVVSVLGSSTSAGVVTGPVVSVLGSTRVTGGTVGDAAVAVLGNVFINGHVKGEAVAVLGNIELGPDAVVDGQIVCVGGEVKRDPKATVNGDIQNVAIGGHYLRFDGLHAWFEQCFLYGRPLAFGEHLTWAWCIALAYLALYVFLALIAPGSVTKCVETLEEQPGKSIVSALLALLLTPVAYLLLVFTLFIGIGFVLIPVFTLGLFLAGLFGKAVMLAWLGRRILRLSGSGAPTQPVLGVLVGGAIVLLLYTVPVLGFVVYKLLGVLGLGVVLYTMILSFKSNRAAAAAASAALGSSVPPPVVTDAPVTPVIPSLPPIISAVTLPRAGFWIRFAAVVLDAIMVGIVCGMFQGMLGWLFRATGSFPLWFAIYNVIMWATKGTTIGGIICGLKVVRIDDRPLDWSVALVRALGAFLSLAVAGLGFIWVAFDDDKQSWHDKIAGTTIVKVPKGTALL